VTATVFYDSVNEIALLSNTFLNSAGAAADPTTVSCIITDPGNVAVTHTYAGTAPADITKVSTGKYTLSVPCSSAAPGLDGLWGYEWAGTGNVSDVQPGTWRVLPVATSQLWYVGLEEMKDRLGITDSADDSVLQTAIAASAGWINEYCGRHFNKVTEIRTFQPDNVWMLDIDDVVPGAPITVRVDQDGDGVYEDPWVQGTDYALLFGGINFNMNASGAPRPYRQLQVLGGGKWLPFTWPYSNLDRVQISTTWGWPRVPWQVPEANRILAADFYKLKDAPFGVAGVSDYGLVRVQSNPWLVELLRSFIDMRRKVGI
jgi:hypothetical protein